jgi:AcrR family transcriptional regulator
MLVPLQVSYMQAARIFEDRSMDVNAGRPRRTQAERSTATRAALLASARALFAAKGYAGAGREEIVEAAGLTRGALYHHFASKEDLFRAVYEELEDDVMHRVMTAAVTTTDPVGQLRRGIDAYLDAALEPDVQRIVLLDAPAVLDPEVRQEIVEARALGMVRETLAWAMREGQVREQPVEPLAHVLCAVIHEAAFYVARAADADAARAEVGTTVDGLLTGLRA